MRPVALCVNYVLQLEVMPCAQSLHIKALFYHYGTDDADCDVSDG
ncbi:hypothetical protein BW686_06670 [Pseudomonas syringae]|uniref:Uncharacterized protein n=2 Tax=Pseudomonas syringae TaxID=317 RepID=A0A244EV86_PSESX|nr:hypothetical protein BW686_06670 [Pseudomonas syringae]